jgi:hypothetical protein
VVVEVLTATVLPVTDFKTINPMKSQKIFSSIALTLCCTLFVSLGSAQNTLNFDTVMIISPNNTYTVPNGKVVKGTKVWCSNSTTGTYLQINGSNVWYRIGDSGSVNRCRCYTTNNMAALNTFFEDAPWFPEGTSITTGTYMFISLIQFDVQ